MTPHTGRGAPVVAVFTGRAPAERYSVHRGYVDALGALGALPVVVPAGAALEPHALGEFVAGCAGVLLGGGGDVDPARYGAPGDPGLMDCDPARDAVELAAVVAARAAAVPVLGICRGAQLLAVAHGGCLVADLPSAGFAGHWEEERQLEPVHAVEAKPGSSASFALGGATHVNSIHHQAVADPGTLEATAWGADGVIEAVESDGVLGVQWHPERLVGLDARHLAPFEWLLGR